MEEHDEAWWQSEGVTAFTKLQWLLATRRPEDRALRLFALACSHTMSRLKPPTPEVQRAREIAEALAAGEDVAPDELYWVSMRDVESAAEQACHAAASACRCLHEVFGNPFEAAEVPAGVRGCGEVRRLVTAAYATRCGETYRLDREVLLALSDAVEEAGLTDVRLLRHLRDGSVRHYPGCWAVEAVREGGDA